MLKRMFAGGAEVITQLLKEVRISEKLQHPNIVRVLGTEVRDSSTGESKEILVLMEYCPGGHLLSRLNVLAEKGRSLTYEKILEVFLSIVRPVAYMHTLPQPLAHRDLKFENVLIAADGSLRLCDFGSASNHAGAIKDRNDRAEQEDAITRFTTPHFRSPEMVDLYSDLPLDTRSDVWALGCMLYALAFLKHPFQDNGPLAILSGKYKLPSSPVYPLPITTAIRQCLQIRPEHRPSAIQLLAYLEACQKVDPAAVAAGAAAWPSLALSGGGYVATVPLQFPAPSHEGQSLIWMDMSGEATMGPKRPGAALVAVSPPALGAGAGSGAGASAAAGTAESGDFSAAAFAAATSPSAGAAASPAPAAGAGHRPSVSYHRPTAAEIAASMQANAGAAKPSAALAARLAKKGGAAPAGAGFASPDPSSSSSGPRRASGADPAVAAGASAEFDAFGSFGAGSASAPSAAAGTTRAAAGGASGPRKASGAGDELDAFASGAATTAPAAAGAGGFDAFGFDAFGAAVPSVSAPSTTTSSRARAASGGTATADPAAAAGDASDFFGFSSGAAAPAPAAAAAAAPQEDFFFSTSSSGQRQQQQQSSDFFGF